ncbi:nidogen-1-like [Lytechinus variegatus]|uniref:nidogen-1-like n=1 Tax=Lytechinus variegatus TaxID=7654 RepID=UPI001BB2A105|nr:nidogen-1-like [Lytechinus variegatus]
MHHQNTSPEYSSRRRSTTICEEIFAETEGIMKLLLGFLAALVAVVQCLPREQFFPFGDGTANKKLSRRSKKTLSITFRDHFTFLGEEQSVLHILRDGYVSFFEGSEVAPFHTKLKLIRGKSSVWYRNTVSPKEEEEIKRLIKGNFRSRGSFDVNNFSPSSFVIVTWENMAIRNRDSNHEVIGTVTFQLILVADSIHSFAFFLYDDDNEYPRPDLISSPIDAGFTSGKAHNQWEFEMVYTTEENKAATLFEAMRDSNVGLNGVWAYKIDGRMDGNIIPAVAYVPLEELPQNDQPPPETVDVQLDNALDVVLNFENQCREGSCSQNGRCVPYPTGYCCACNEGFIGNGIHCLSNDNNGRMNGNVNGTVNGVTIPDDVYIHTFIMGGGGRTFTAISPVPSSLSYTLQLLLPIGELMGWMFAEPATKGINGFMQTGGVLLYSANIRFDGGEEVSITQRYTGVDDSEAEGVISGYVNINGDVPYLPPGTSVNVIPHSEVYTKYRPGYVHSSEERELLVNANTADERTISFTIEQTITYEECEADDIDTDASLTAMRMNTTYAYSIFEPQGEILRYAMVTSVGPDIGVPTDACENNNCGENAECFVQGDSFTCQCRSGFTGNGYTCVEEDPCANNQCDRNADCSPAAGGYSCFCRSGYEGNGYNCQPEGSTGNPCDNNDCDSNADCYPAGDTFTCQCAPGFNGDGRVCVPDEGSDPCDTNDCSLYAYCYPDGEGFYCQCAPGFIGDGRNCEREQSGNPCDNNNCSPYAYCRPRGDTAFYCECAPGYTGDGYNCQEENPCVNNRCHPNADCFPAPGGYSCSCQSGYEGDGYICELADQLVNVCEDCSTDASCYPEGRGYRCICNGGYNGDGITCTDVNECLEGAEIACDENAQCQNTRGSYRCRCNPGYQGDGYTCQALPEVEGSLVFGYGMSVMNLPLDGSQGSKVYMKSRQTVVGIGYDCIDEHVYWTDVSGRTIMRASIDGRDVSVIINSSLSSPEGVAIDHLSRNMYWTDSGFDRIEVSNLDGRNRHVLFDTDLVNPRSIVVDPVGGYLYWADWDRSYPRIEVSSTDGSNREVFLDTDIVMPNGLTIDLISNRLCWADAGEQAVSCMNRNKDPDSRYQASTAEYPFALTLLGYDLYWTDWLNNNIQSVNINGGVSQSHALPRGGNGKPYGIAAITQCPAGNNRCNYQNGGCRNLCLPAPDSRATCVCPNALAPNDIPCN